MSDNQNEIDFEKSLHTLETLVEKMETGDLTLEQSLEAFEQGIGLTKTCQSALKHAEQRVQILIEKSGNQTLKPFDAAE